MFNTCDRCNRNIELNEGYVNISYNVQAQSKNIMTQNTEINVEKSNSVLTLCGNCGNQFSASNVKEHLEFKESLYTYEEISTHIRTLASCMQIDNGQEQLKKNYIIEVCKKNKLTPQQVQSILDVKLSSDNIVIPSDPKTRLTFLTELYDIMFIDGNINEGELSYLKKVADVYGVSEQYINDIITREALFRNLFAFSRIDGSTTDSEMEFIKRLLTHTTLDNPINWKRIFILNQNTFSLHIPKSLEQKTYHLMMYIDLALKDGDLKDEELEYLFKLNDNAYKVPKEFLIELVNNRIKSI